MKKVIFMLLLSILTLNSCSMLSYTVSEFKKVDWDKTWWWNREYPKEKPKPLVKVTECNKKGICKEKHTRYPIY